MGGTASFVSSSWSSPVDEVFLRSGCASDVPAKAVGEEATESDSGMV
jgi:hypothetical protein